MREENQAAMATAQWITHTRRTGVRWDGGRGGGCSVDGQGHGGRGLTERRDRAHIESEATVTTLPPDEGH